MDSHFVLKCCAIKSISMYQPSTCPIKSKCRLNGEIGLYIMPRERSYEIDEPEDLTEIRNYLCKINH